MLRTTIAFAAGLAFTTTLPAISAHAALRDRTFVASYGSDSNPCTFGSPCKTFQQAVNMVATGGEVTAIDSAGFGPISIGQSVTITSPAGVEAGIVPGSSGIGIVINATSSSVVTLHGLTIDGAGVGGTGISLTQAGMLVIVDCIVRNFLSSGMALAPFSPSNITVSDTIVANNAGDGIYVQPTGTDPSEYNVVFNRVQALGNGQIGIGIFANLSSNVFINAIAVDSVASSGAANHQTGFYALGGSAQSDAQLQVFRSTATGNYYGVRAENGGQITVSQSHLEGNQISWSVDGITNSKVFSYGDNYTGGFLAPPSGTTSKN
jgi:hypothetical protein